MGEYDELFEDIVFIEREDDVYATDIDDLEWDETLIPEVVFDDDETFFKEEDEWIPDDVDDVDWFRNS